MAHNIDLTGLSKEAKLEILNQFSKEAVKLMYSIGVNKSWAQEITNEVDGKTYVIGVIIKEA